MRIDIITLFPDMFTGPLTESIIKRAVNDNKLEIVLHQLRDFATDKHGTVDDSPYGGGAGMVLKVDVIDRAIESIVASGPKPYIVLMTPQGRVLKQAIARELAQYERLLLICGHYEGFDERIRDLVDAEISIGDYVLTGGELAAMVITDAVARLIPGVLGKDESSAEESHENGLLEYPHYTRPEEFNGQKVPSELLSGNHALIKQWRENQAQSRTAQRRPDLRD
jgi:tRNA (guanine37-N1)-methyltransferase